MDFASTVGRLGVGRAIYLNQLADTRARMGIAANSHLLGWSGLRTTAGGPAPDLPHISMSTPTECHYIMAVSNTAINDAAVINDANAAAVRSVGSRRR